MKLVIASKNRGKIKEISKAFSDLGIEAVSLLDFENIPEAPETGETFLENVYQKSSFYSKYFNLPVISDDSGLVVDILGGLPGVNSSRFAGENATDKENLEKIIYLLRRKNVNNSSATFKCFMMVTFKDMFGFWSEGELKGKVITEPRGNGGFGYDPIFVPENSNRTLAQYDSDEKNRISHRGKALEKIMKIVRERLW